MRICHATNSLTRTGGGTAQVVWALASKQARLGDSVRVLGLDDPYDHIDHPAECRMRHDVEVFERSGPHRLGWSASLHSRMLGSQFIATTDIVHQHGIWSLLSHSVSRFGGTSGKPVIISVHGMLGPTAMKTGRIRKRIFRALVERGNLTGASCLHALNVQEAENMRRYGLDNPVAVIPNGVDIHRRGKLADREAFYALCPEARRRRCILYLSRLHRLKGLYEMIDGWASVPRRLRRNWLLIVAGGGSKRLVGRLVCRDLRSDPGSGVRFVGPLYGREKRAALSAVDAFVLPSLSEGFPMALLEAMAAGLPAIATRACNFPAIERCQAGWVAETTIRSIARAFEDCLSLSDVQRRRMGRNGRNLVRRRYTWDAAAGRMRRVYAWLLGAAPRPESVELP